MDIKTDVDIVVEVLEDCPNCRHNGILYRTGKDEYFVACGRRTDCAKTGRYGTIQEAINAWNEQDFS